MNNTTKEIFSFDRNMIFQCAILFLGICSGLIVNWYCLLFVAFFTIIVSMFGKTKNIYYHLLFCLPFNMIYKLSPPSTSIFAYVLLIVGIILLIRIRHIDGVQLALIVLFAIYVFFGMGNNYTLVIKMVVGMLLFYFFVKKINPSDFKNQIMAFTLGMLGSSLIGLFKGSWPRLNMCFSDMNTIYIDGVKSYRFSGLYLDPNYYSISVIIALGLCAMLFMKKDGNRAILGIIIAALSVFGFLSYSKMFIVTYVALLAVVLLSILKKSHKRILAIFVMTIVGTIGLLWIQKSGYIYVMLERFNIEDISTGRLSIWKNYLGYFLDSPFTLIFGEGLNAKYLAGIGPHNTLIEMVYFVGLLGGLLFLLAISSILLIKKYKFRRSIMNYILPALFIFMCMTLGCFTINDLMFYCMLLWVGFNINMSDKSKKISKQQK